MSAVILASIPRRAGARAVDLAVMLGPAIASVSLIGSTMIGFPVFLILLLCGAAQDPLGTAHFGQSIGKWLFRIRVVNARTHTPPNLWHAFLRWWLSLLVPPLVVWVTWDEHRQGIHDKAAETLVVCA